MNARDFHMKSCRRTLVVVLTAALVAVSSARAGIENAGTTAANFLSLGSGARTLGMGGAALGASDDLAGTAWNPAALGWLTETEGALSHAGLPSSSLQEWGGIGGRIGSTRTRWAATGHYQGDGSFEGRDATGTATGIFSASSFAVGATVAQQIGGAVTVGLGAKGVSERLGTVSGSGFTFDAGIMLRVGMLGLGVAGQNLGGQMTYGSSRYPFPRNVGAGLGLFHRSSGLRLALDANFPSAYHPDLRGGVEWDHKGTLALRAGYRKELGSDRDPLSGPSFGVSAGRNGMWLDYGYLLLGDGAGQHRMGLRFKLSSLSLGDPVAGPREAPADAKRPSETGSERPRGTKP